MVLRKGYTLVRNEKLLVELFCLTFIVRLLIECQNRRNLIRLILNEVVRKRTCDSFLLFTVFSPMKLKTNSCTCSRKPTNTPHVTFILIFCNQFLNKYMSGYNRRYTIRFYQLRELGNDGINVSQSFRFKIRSVQSTNFF